MLPVNIYSAYTLEPWDYDSPWTTGIGGSEVFHLEMAIRLAKRGIQVTSWCPLPEGKDGLHQGVEWKNSANVPRSFGKSIVINVRDPQIFATPKGEERRYFVAQDVDYEGHWSNERLASVDRYITLCDEHASFTLSKYPMLKGRVYISSNGVRKDVIDKVPAQTRDYNRLLYASSPDRGLKLLLENWFRVRERFPKAELRVAYGLNNMEKIISMMGGGTSWHAGYKAEIEQLLQQEGVTWLGRIPQDQLYREWFQAGTFAYPSDWPETACISIMDAMSCGAVPVVANHWAQGQHARASKAAYVIDGLPQKSDLVKMHWLDSLYKCLEEQPAWDEPDFYGATRRERMMTWARESFDWERTVDQFVAWLEEDSKDA